MKKLLVVALSAMLVLAYATVSMAAITWTGEANVGLQISPDGSQGQFSDCKVVADAAINDTVSVNAAIKGGVSTLYADSATEQLSTNTATIGLDTYSISNKFDMGTLKLGFFGVNLNGKRDILGCVIPELKPASMIQFAANVGEGMTAAISYDYLEAAAYVASFTYDVAPLYVQVGIENYTPVTDPATIPSPDAVSGTALNVGYNIGDALCVFLNYETVGDLDLTDQIVGVTYTTGAIGLRFEYNAEQAADSNPMGLRVQYTAADSLIYTLEYVNDGSGDDPSMKVKATAKF